jgi:LAS superfamily LD-carboxypeptidase LdcB
MSLAAIGRTTRSRLRRQGLSRLALSLIALVVGVAVATGCQAQLGGQHSPINPANRPTTIAGVTNGNLPASQLYVWNSKCTIFKGAAGSFNAMMAAAKADGVSLHPAECYRDYAGQVYWRKYWCKVGICANAATPGYSNHGWGKAVDLRDQKGSLTWTSPGYKWMVKHAGEYGWNHPGGVNEAWHWEWVGDGGTMGGYAVLPGLMFWAK